MHPVALSNELPSTHVQVNARRTCSGPQPCRRRVGRDAAGRCRKPHALANVPGRRRTQSATPVSRVLTRRSDQGGKYLDADPFGARPRAARRSFRRRSKSHKLPGSVMNPAGSPAALGRQPRTANAAGPCSGAVFPPAGSWPLFRSASRAWHRPVGVATAPRNGSGVPRQRRPSGLEPTGRRGGPGAIERSATTLDQEPTTSLTRGGFGSPLALGTGRASGLTCGWTMRKGPRPLRQKVGGPGRNSLAPPPQRPIRALASSAK